MTPDPAAGKRSVRRKALSRIWLPAVALALVYPALALDLDDRLMLLLEGSWRDPQAGASSLDFGQYRVEVEALPVAGVSDNLSGLAYDDKRGHLWAVINEPAELLAVGKDGRVLARHRLEGLDDVEGVAYLGDDLLALIEERRGTLTVVAVPDDAGSLNGLTRRTLTLDVGTNRNRSLEGVGYDRGRDRLFVVKEHSPRRLYEIQGLKASLNGGPEVRIVERTDWVDDRSFAEDLSSVEYDETTGRLLLLSDESRLVVELGAEGRVVSLHKLSSGFAGLARRVSRAEGMAFDDQRNFYLVSEPNLFYAFRRR